MAQPVRHVPLRAREEVVSHRHLVAMWHQMIDKMATNETGATYRYPGIKQPIMVIRSLETMETLQHIKCLFYDEIFDQETHYKRTLQFKAKK